MNSLDLFTVVIQGRLTKKSIDFYRANNPGCAVIISTWKNTPVDLSNLPPNFRVVYSEYPSNVGRDNRRLQITTVLNGLKEVKTQFAIKTRGDECYSNLKYIMDEVLLDENKIYTLPMFFRHWSVRRFHISDHLIAGRIDQLLMMWESTNTLSLEKFTDRYCNEQLFALAYLSAKYKDVDFFGKESLSDEFNIYLDNTLDIKDGIKFMIESFEILDLKQLEPYLISTTHIGKTHSHFIPEGVYGSISRISMLLSSKEQYNGIIGSSLSRRQLREEPIPLTGKEYDGI